MQSESDKHPAGHGQSARRTTRLVHKRMSLLVGRDVVISMTNNLSPTACTVYPGTFVEIEVPNIPRLQGYSFLFTGPLFSRASASVYIPEHGPSQPICYFLRDTCRLLFNTHIMASSSAMDSVEHDASILLDPTYTTCKIDPLIYGGFLEYKHCIFTPRKD